MFTQGRFRVYLTVSLVLLGVVVWAPSRIVYASDENTAGDVGESREAKSRTDQTNLQTAAEFGTSDLAGQWFLGASDIQNNHTWDGLLILDGSGSVTGGTFTSSEGPSYTFTGGALAIDATGKVTGIVTDSDGVTTQLTLQMNLGKNVMAGEGNATNVAEDGLFILTKKAVGFITSDLAGQWVFGGSNIQNEHTWDGVVVVNTAGTVTGGSLVSSLGDAYSFIGGTLAIDAAGKVTGTVTDSGGATTALTLQMSSDLDTMAGEGNGITYAEDGVFVLVWQSSGFVTADLEGQWFLGASDLQGDHTWDGTLGIDSAGQVTGGTFVSSEGDAYTFTGGALSIDTAGKVTGSVTDSDGVTTQLTMQMNDSGDIIAGEGNVTGGSEDGVFMLVKKPEERFVYRFWSPVHSRHFYTINEAERQTLIQTYSHVWIYEGPVYLAFDSATEAGLVPVYRFWSGVLNGHFYTTDTTERDKLINIYPDVWTYEGIAWYAYAAGAQPLDSKPVYRFWSDTLSGHFYTIDEAESDKLINIYSHVWTYEGIAWYAYE